MGKNCCMVIKNVLCISQAFVDAWKQACSTPKAVLLVPEGRRYLVNATRFRGPCADKIVIQVRSCKFSLVLIYIYIYIWLDE